MPLPEASLDLRCAFRKAVVELCSHLLHFLLWFHFCYFVKGFMCLDFQMDGILVKLLSETYQVTFTSKLKAIKSRVLRMHSLK